MHTELNPGDPFLYSTAALALALIATLASLAVRSAIKLKAAERRADEQKAKLDEAQAESRKAGEDLAGMRAILGARDDTIRDVTQRLGAEQAKLASLSDERTRLEAERQTLARELELLRKQAGIDKTERQEAFDRQLDTVRKELQIASEKLLKQRENELKAVNKEQMDAIVAPLKESLQNLKKEITENREASAKSQASIEKHIGDMMTRAIEVGAKADNLADALRNGHQKMQGCMGELILKDLLEAQGLREGENFVLQESLLDKFGELIRNEQTNRRMIPDAVVYYPDKRKVVIDAKVSLTAFVDFSNADSDDARDEALKRHVASVRSHVAELAGKEYHKYVQGEMQAIDFVIMFVPNDNALDLALDSDRRLWRDAYDKKVIITGSRNLATLLRIIELAWVAIRQNNSMAMIVKNAELMLDRIANFASEVESIGKAIGEMQKCYEGARDKLFNGRQSIRVSAQNLQALGVKSKKQMPAIIADDMPQLPSSPDDPAQIAESDNGEPEQIADGDGGAALPSGG